MSANNKTPNVKADNAQNNAPTKIDNNPPTDKTGNNPPIAQAKTVNNPPPAKMDNNTAKADNNNTTTKKEEKKEDNTNNNTNANPPKKEVEPQLIIKKKEPQRTSNEPIDPEYLEWKKWKEKESIYKNHFEHGQIVNDYIDGSNIAYKRFHEAEILKRKNVPKRGVSTLDMVELTPNVLDFYLSQELSSKLAQKIIIQFLAYKPLQFTNYTEAVLNTIPKKLKFEFDFWSYQCLETAPCAVNIPKDDFKISNQPLELTNENSVVVDSDVDKRVFVELTYDPSIEATQDFREFLAYLISKNMNISVIDVDKHFKIGYLKVPLKDLIRGGKPQVVVTKEYEIFDDNFEVKGYIQMLLQNTSQDTKKEFVYNLKDLKEVNSLDCFNKGKSKKRCVVRPLDTNQLSQEQKEKIGQMMILQNSNFRGANFKEENYMQKKQFNLDPELDKRLRVIRFMNAQNGMHAANNRLQMEEDRIRAIRHKKEEADKFYKNIEYINKVRNIGKDFLLNQVTMNSNKTQFKVSLVQGQPFYFNYMIKNDSENEELFHIIIRKSTNDETNNFVGDNVVSIVSNAKEWANVVDEFKLNTPADFNVIGSDNYIKILPNETIPIPIKLLSFKNFKSEITYNICIHKSNDQPLFFLELVIEKCFPIIDHIFTYNAPCNISNDLSVINPFKSKAVKLLQNSLISDNSVNFAVDSESNDFKFKFLTKQSGYIHEFFVFFYKDDQRHFLYMTWKFIINSINFLELSCNIGSKKHDKIIIENTTNETKSLRLFSENENIVFSIETGEFTLLPNTSIEKKIIVFPKNFKDDNCMLNCVDSNTGELFNTWLIKINPQRPYIDETCTVECRVGVDTNFTYKFTNELGTCAVLNFDSENESFLKIIDSRIMFNAKETKVINMLAPGNYTFYEMEVLVFIFDAEEIFSKTVLFKLTYK